jgi:hypothetical protein
VVIGTALPVNRLLPAAALASLAAPVVYILFIVMSSLYAGRSIDIAVLLTIAASSAFFSFFTTCLLALLVIGVAKARKKSEINVPVIAIAALALIGVLAALAYGIRPAGVLVALAASNAIALVLITAMRRGG